MGRPGERGMREAPAAGPARAESGKTLYQIFPIFPIFPDFSDPIVIKGPRPDRPHRGVEIAHPPSAIPPLRGPSHAFLSLYDTVLSPSNASLSRYNHYLDTIPSELHPERVRS